MKPVATSRNARANRRMPATRNRELLTIAASLPDRRSRRSMIDRLHPPQADEAGADRALDPVHRYHDGTKHHFNRFARSLGYLDWASQPRPFRTYAGARTFPLYPDPVATAGPYVPRHATFDALFTPDQAPLELTAQAVGDVLRHSLGLSAWKQSGPSRWALRVNPSSGNLHPTEAYVICGALEGLALDRRSTTTRQTDTPSSCAVRSTTACGVKRSARSRTCASSL